MVTVRVAGNLPRAVVIAYAHTKHGVHKTSSTRAVTGAAIVVLRMTVPRGGVSVCVTVTAARTVLKTHTIHLEV